MRAPLASKAILVTGGAGFIGSHLVDRLITEGATQVVVIDNLFLGSEDNLNDALNKGLYFHNDDAVFSSSLDYIFKRYKIDIVFNCATKALNYSFINPKNAFDTNVDITLNLLEHQRQGSFETLCQLSTSEVYGTAVYEPMDEQHPRNPTTSYAAGKAAADLAVESYVRMFDLDSFIVRPFNNYGPRQNYKGVLAGLIPATIRKILNGQPPELQGNGRQSRDFIYVDDTIDAVINLYSKLPSGESVNISTDNTITIRDVIDQTCQLMGYTGEILNTPARASDVFCHTACNKKVRSLIDYRLTPFEHGLVETVEWYKKHISRESS